MQIGPASRDSRCIEGRQKGQGRKQASVSVEAVRIEVKHEREIVESRELGQRKRFFLEKEYYGYMHVYGRGVEMRIQ